MDEKPTLSKLWKENQNLRYLVFSLINSFVFYVIYAVLIGYAERSGKIYLSFVVMLVYVVLLVGFTLAYLIYNRFLYRQNVKIEDLPDTMTYEEKEVFVADSARRLKRSKWMMLIILPLVITFLIDAVDLFILDLFR